VRSCPCSGCLLWTGRARQGLAAPTIPSGHCQVDELKLLEHIEKLADAWRPEGEWLTKLDVEKKRDKLVIIEMDQVGR
jgi:hypothetical protein